MTAVEEAVAAVGDPEIRVLTIADLGILRGRRATPTGRVTVTITPDLHGLPGDGRDPPGHRRRRRATPAPPTSRSVTVLSPPWTTDWISADGRAKLAAAGIGAAQRTVAGRTMLTLTVRCPRCGSPDTEELSRFGSTACKSLWRCRACREPFDAVKAH